MKYEWYLGIPIPGTIAFLYLLLRERTNKNELFSPKIALGQAWTNNKGTPAPKGKEQKVERSHLPQQFFKHPAKHVAHRCQGMAMAFCLRYHPLEL